MRTKIEIIDDDGERIYKEELNRLLTEEALEEILTEIELKLRRKAAVMRIEHNGKLI